MSGRKHWEAIYQRKGSTEVSWYRPHLDRSLDLVIASGIGRDAAVIDVGGGTSTLVDDLLARGYSDLTVLDVSERALRHTQERLGEKATVVQWIVGDITEVTLPEARFDFWHDRAVFHFLVEEEARRRYLGAVRRSLRPGGHIVVATFGIGGPEQCSGLDVMRYTSDTLHAEFGPAFQKVSAFQEAHVTPWGTEQAFVYCYCRRPPADAPRRNP